MRSASEGPPIRAAMSSGVSWDFVGCESAASEAEGSLRVTSECSTDQRRSSFRRGSVAIFAVVVRMFVFVGWIRVVGVDLGFWEDGNCEFSGLMRPWCFFFFLDA